MQSVDYAKMSLLVAEMTKSLSSLKDAQRRAHLAVGEAILADVKRRIGGSGKVQSWQAAHIGSGGGYVAVRAKADTFYTQQNAAGETSWGAQRYAVGYITNAIENGHDQNLGMFVGDLSSTSFWGGQLDGGARLVHRRVAGRGFYADARGSADTIAQSAAQDFAQEIAAELNGMG